MNFAGGRGAGGAGLARGGGTDGGNLNARARMARVAGSAIEEAPGRSARGGVWRGGRDGRRGAGWAARAWGVIGRSRSAGVPRAIPLVRKGRAERAEGALARGGVHGVRGARGAFPAIIQIQNYGQLVPVARVVNAEYEGVEHDCKERHEDTKLWVRHND
jgi:hypothetical protein